MSVFSYYSNPVPTTTVYEEHGYRSRPGQSRTVFHTARDGPFVVVTGMPLSSIIEQPEVAAPAQAMVSDYPRRVWVPLVAQ